MIPDQKPQPTLLRCIKCDKWVEQHQARCEFPMGCICNRHKEVVQ